MKNTKQLEFSYIKAKHPVLYRIFTILPGSFALTILIITISGYSLFLFNEYYTYHKIVFFIAMIISLYYIWWLIRGFEYITYTFLAAFKIQKYKKLDFKRILRGKGPEKNPEYCIMKKALRKDMHPDEVIHRFMIPTYKEQEHILDETIQALLDSEYDHQKFAVTLNGEQADEEHFLQVAQNLMKKYKKKFGYLSYTVHPKGVPGEIPGKGANIKYAAKKEYKKILKAFDTTPDKVVVTTLDADTKVDIKYPIILTYTYIRADDRKRKSFEPMIFFFNNFWDAPFFSKIISLGNSFFLLFNCVKKYGLKNFSTHAQPLDALIELDFWSKETIVEDGHQYWRSYVGFGGDYEVLPLYTKVYQDANLNTNIFSTAKAQYNQIRRWAHGAEDIPYIVTQWYDLKNKLGFKRTFYEVFRHIEAILLWSTLHIMLMFGLTFTFIKDIKLSSHISLGGVISIAVNVSFIIFILVLSLQLMFSPWDQLKNWKIKAYHLSKFLLLYIWVLGPCLFIFSGTPAFHTQIALMLGKPMKKFNVTEKIRKK